ncbi:MAG TPA: hypothetical protein PLB55_03250 [Prosthecobacter sp.]|jgi:predicted homoserine dehydrogenase-like protein|nr:hypothetical protein [Prosthecobacter sp.]
MYNILREKLEQRSRPVAVAVIGCGWFGSGLMREIFRIKGMRVSAAIDINPEHAIRAYGECGVPAEDVALVKNVRELAAAERSQKHIVATDIRLIKSLGVTDAVFEATGSILAGAEAATAAIAAGIHFVTVNSEADATIGLRLATLAHERGIVYSNSDGDQPGCLARLINEVSMMGFRPRVAGNCKGFLDTRQTPAGAIPFTPQGQSPTHVCSYADGSKQALELAVVANAFGMPPLKRGMFGPTTTKSQLVNSFCSLVDFESLNHGIVDYVMGINGIDQGAGVFVVASREGSHIASDMEYLKKGKGPNYLFFRDHHLCYLEAASSIAEAVLFSVPTMVPKGRYADVVAVAKRDIPAGQKLDGIGGYDCYGLIEKADVVANDRLLPLGLTEFATLRKKVSAGELITHEMVGLEDNLAVRLRRDLEQLHLALF